MIAAPHVTTQLDLFIAGPNDELHYDAPFGKACRAMCNRFTFGASWSFEHYGMTVRIFTTNPVEVAAATAAMVALAKRWDGRRGLDFKKN